MKATQWLTWSGHFDHGSAWNIGGLQALIDARDRFAAGGIELWPWGVPMGLDANGNTASDANGVEAEAQRFASIANAIGKVDLDVEPYSDFWPAVAVGDYDAVTPLFSRIRELAPNAVITMDLPYRAKPSVEDRLLSPVIEMASPFVDAFYLQSYFGVDQAKDAEARAKTHTDKPVFHIIAANPNQFGDMLDWQSTVHAADVAVWLADTMNKPLYDLLAGHDFGSGPTHEQAIQWQAPGFANLFAQNGAAMGDPIDLPYSDNFGNVFQDSVTGTAVWMKPYNANFWLPKPAGVGLVMPPTTVIQANAPRVAAITAAAAATGAAEGVPAGG